MSPFIPLVTRGLLRAHLILFRRDTDEDHVGVFGFLEAQLSLAFVALLIVILRGLIEPWHPVGPVLIPTIIVMAALAAWWLARYNSLMDTMGPLADPDAPTGFTGHASYVWNRPAAIPTRRRINEWRILGVSEPLKLGLPGLALLGFQSTAAAGMLLIAVAATAAVQTRRDRLLDRFEAEREASFSGDQVSVMDNGERVVDAIPDEEEFEESIVQRIGVRHGYDEFGTPEQQPTPPETFYQKRQSIKPPIRRGPQSAPNLRWPSLLVTGITMATSLGVWAGDRFGLYQAASGRVLAVAQSIDRELAVIGVSPRDTLGPGLDDLLLQRIDEDTWRERQQREHLLASRKSLVEELAAAEESVRRLRAECETLPGDFELAPGPATFHKVLLTNEAIATDWALLVLELKELEASLEDLRAESAQLLKGSATSSSFTARAESVRLRISTINETMAKLSHAHRRVAAAL
jgi:hypothetical protein